MKSLKLAAVALFATAALSAQDLKTSEVPTNLTTSFEKDYSKASDVEWEKEMEYFKVEFDMDRMENEIWYDASGKMVKMEKEINQKDLPQAIKSAISSKYASLKMDDVEMREENVEITYKVELENGNEEKTIIFNEDGTVKNEYKD